jgi:diguanylate cyclase (GGDEF)-like protein/PAS domain S-box-containing protein
MTPQEFSLKSFLLVAFLLLLPVGAGAAQNILILHSYHRGYEWTDNVKLGMESVLKREAPDAELFVENMDTKRNDPAHIFPELRRFLLAKYAGKKFDIILASDDNALDFLLNWRDELFPGAPVVFCGINNFEDGRIAGHPGFTGVAEDIDMRKTLEIALKLHPRTRTVAVVDDLTTTGRANLARLHKIKGLFEDRIEFLELVGLPHPALRKALAKLPDDSLILRLAYYRDPDGHFLTVAQGNALITESRRPVYTLWDFMVNNGVMGGRVVSGLHQGETAAELAVRILKGETPEQIPVVRQSPNVFMFDYPAIQKFGIDPRSLPPESIILHDPTLSQQQYKRQLLQILAVTGIFIGLSCWLGFALLQRRQAIKALRQSEGTLQAMLQSIGDPTYMMDRNLTLIWANAPAREIFGRDIVGKKCHQVLQHIDQPYEPETCHALKAFETGRIHSSERQLLSAAGEKRTFLCTTNVALRDNQGEPKTVLTISRDVTALKRVQEEIHLAKRAMDSSITPIVMVNMQGVLTYVNKATLDLWGYASAEEILGRDLKDFYLRSHKVQEVLQHLMKYGVWRGDGQARKKDGSIFEVDVLAQVVKNPQGMPLSVMASAIDITEKKKAEQEIRRLAYMDSLTDLPNRELLKDHMELALSHAERFGEKVAVLLFDLDNFKQINDTLGHAMGDRLLQAVAKRLRSMVRSCETLARWGGDEFVLLQTDVRTEQEPARVAEKMLDLLSREPFLINQNEVYTTASIGISIFPQDGQDSDSLLKQADTAMYEAKRKGRNDYHFFSEQLAHKAGIRHRMEANLRRAVQQEEFSLVYQPQVDLGLGRTVGLEALVRWSPPGEEPVPPAQFIGVAEETGLIRPLGEWILRTACSQAASWQKAGNEPLRVAVNLSPQQLHQPNLVEIIEEILRDTALPPTLLELELTESVFMENLESAVTILSALRALGIRISIDDFGTGYSSLGYLKNLPIDRIKIAQDFVRDIPADQDDMAIIEATIAMARSLGLKIIAEGVENRQQLEFLMSRGCNEMQGYYFARPLAPKDIAGYMATGLQYPTGPDDWY